MPIKPLALLNFAGVPSVVVVALVVVLSVLRYVPGPVVVVAAGSSALTVSSVAKVRHAAPAISGSNFPYVIFIMLGPFVFCLLSFRNPPDSSSVNLPSLLYGATRFLPGAHGVLPANRISIDGAVYALLSSQ